jgi:sporulation protein YlmC with PRC-barrel domain
MNTTRKIATGALAALCLTLGGGLKAADTTYDKQGKHEKYTEGMPAKFNKASGIIGMDVRNHKDERLGEIKDVVFDLKSEKVAYAVLGTGGLLDRQKLLAVPLNAFTASADNKYLILRADKSKLETATGFDRESWPSVTNPSWGAQPFWEKPTGTEKQEKTPSETPKP